MMSTIDIQIEHHKANSKSLCSKGRDHQVAAVLERPRFTGGFSKTLTKRILDPRWRINGNDVSILKATWIM